METNYTMLYQLAESMPPITLEEMKSVKLMKRTDMKFVTDVDTLAQLLRLAADSYFSQSNVGSRVSPYRTVYWDTCSGHEMFRTHQCGHRPRTKVRARTYLDSGHSFLEIKKKDNHGKTRKKRVPVPSIEAVMETRVGEDFLKEQTDYSFDTIRPALGNEFRRITLVNKAKTERLTIDFGLRFHNYETGVDNALPQVAIIELKRDGRCVSPILPLLRQLRIKPAGFSKYCIGTTVTNAGIRAGRFKKRLIKIGKIVGAVDAPCLRGKNAYTRK